MFYVYLCKVLEITFLQRKIRFPEEAFTEGSTQFPSDVTCDLNLKFYHISTAYD